MPDISQLVRASGIDAKRTAVELFGMAVEDFAAGPLNDVLRTATGQPANPPIDRNDGSWYATSYAHSLANSQFRPKMKFLFRVEFLFKDGVLEEFGRADWQRNFAFLIKSVDRPKVDFEYEEVNQYNFRTKVLKQIKHRELTMTFMDDVGNNVYEFFRFMMMVHSPITRRSVTATQNITDAHVSYSTGSGMEFTEGLGGINDFAHRGAVNTEFGNVIQAIKVTQIFLNQTNPVDDAAKQVSFFFINPRIVSFDLDDVNHEVSDPNLFTMQFDYDFMVMSKMDPLEVLPPEKQLPPKGSAPGDSAPTGRNPSSQTGQNNPYTAILAGVAGRAAQRITSETIGRVIRQVPGLGSVADTLGNIAKGSILGISKTVNQSFARPTRDVIADASTSGPDKASYTSSTGGFGPTQPGVNENGEA